MEIGDKVIGDYELLSVLGEGAAGTVYKAKHVETGELVALKLLHGQLENDEGMQRRFVREVSVLERLRHPNIVGHRDCGIHVDKIYFAMELVDSGTLDKVLLKRGALPWRLAVEAAMQVCDALAYAHAEGVIHRDLKPANLFLSGDGHVKVGDFGLARDLSRDRLTVEGQTVGTVRYMAPEQVQGRAEVSGSADLYSLGCMLFQMVSGQPPYDGASIVDVFKKHLFEEPPVLSERVPGSPRELDEAIFRLLEKAPDDRPEDAAAARGLLASVLGYENAEAQEQQAETPAANLTDQLTEVPTPPERNLKAAAAAVVGVVAVGLIAWLLSGRG
ncbi:MAG: serine/threonine-protein kinase [Planctomycetota bacterium]